MNLKQFPETLAVVRLPAGAEIPAWAEASSVFSITATATETSLVCAGRSVPTKVRHQKPFIAFEVEGPLDFAEVDILHGLLGPLKDDGISVFVLSTFDTDWLLIQQKDAEKAAESWRRSGHTVAPAVPAKPQRSPAKSDQPRKPKK
jgi:hypothetical protein